MDCKGKIPCGMNLSRCHSSAGTAKDRGFQVGQKAEATHVA